MNQSLKITNLKNESADLHSNRNLEILNEVQMSSIKEESDCLESNIKTEPQEYDTEFLTISQSYEMCPNYDVKVEMDEPVVKLECENLNNENMEDPLDVSGVIKDAGIQENPPSASNVAMESKKEIEGKECQTSEEESESQEERGSNNKKHLLERNTGKKPFSCKICEKSFYLKHNLNSHMIIHTFFRVSAFTCHICDKSFNQKGNLDSHMLIHSDENEYLNKLIHSGLKPISCSECGKSFRQSHLLAEHKRIHTISKQYSCDVCNKEFLRRTHLIIHKRLHTGEKPYTCKRCNKSFTQISNLNKHKKTHKR